MHCAAATSCQCRGLTPAAGALAARRPTQLLAGAVSLRRTALRTVTASAADKHESTPSMRTHAAAVDAPSAPTAAPARAPAPKKPSAPIQGINVDAHIQANITPFDGDATFLAGPTERSKTLWAQIEALKEEERRRGIMGVDPSVPSTITAFTSPPGYIDQELEVIKGLQTDEPLKRAIKPQGGVGVVKNALKAYGRELDPAVEFMYTNVRKTHNQGVFDAYTPAMRAARSNHILTGLPDGYGRGRIIGDYRRVALYGVDALVEAKMADLSSPGLCDAPMTQDKIRLREEVNDQIRALQDLKELGAAYGDDLSRPAATAREAVQWVYYAYLAAVKEQDGAAMSLGRVDAFLDSYMEKDLAEGRLDEATAQELIDQFVMKLRIVRQLRTPEYDNLFAGDPTWVTAVLGGADQQGNHMVTKTSYRILNTLYNLGPAPEPNITILWHPSLPESFKQYCAGVSLDTSSIQYENDAMMSSRFGSDYAIACCVSAMRLGKDMQFFGARANLAKLMLYSLNSGKDEVSGKQVGPILPAPVLAEDGSLQYDDVAARLDTYMSWLAELYSSTMNVIHCMHDKYNYEKVQMALHDTHVRRLMAYGIAGLSVVTDSLSAIQYGKVFPIYDERGLMTDFRTEGVWPCYGNDDERVDSIAANLVKAFHDKLAKQHTYRDALPTLSVLTITSNVVYGKATGNTPDGRRAGEPFAPGANPMHGRDASGALASLNSVAAICYDDALDGVSNTFSLVPAALGKSEAAKANNLVSILDGYFEKGGHHLNVNTLNRDTLVDAMEHPEAYPNLTIRVSGYAVHFTSLTREQQTDVISRTFHSMM